MVYLLYTLFFISCIVLIATVLLQPGKTDAGALFTSGNVSSTAFQPRGAQTILSKMTIAAATTFMLTALLLAMPALTGNVSVLQTNAENQTDSAPVADTNAETSANSSSDGNANTNVVVNSNTAIVVPANTTSNTELPANK